MRGDERRVEETWACSRATQQAHWLSWRVTTAKKDKPNITLAGVIETILTQKLEHTLFQQQRTYFHVCTDDSQSQ